MKARVWGRNGAFAARWSACDSDIGRSGDVQRADTDTPEVTIRAAQKRSARRYASFGLLVASVPGLAACSTDAADAPANGCPGFAHMSGAAPTELAVTPPTVHAGGTVTVGRTDRARMEFSSFTLYGDAEAGCRVYSLFLGGSGKSGSREITHETEGSVMSIVRSARQQRYVLPSGAAPGGYLLCLDEMPSKVTCGEFRIASRFQ